MHNKQRESRICKPMTRWQLYNQLPKYKLVTVITLMTNRQMKLRSTVTQKHADSAHRHASPDKEVFTNRTTSWLLTSYQPTIVRVRHSKNREVNTS